MMLFILVLGALWVVVGNCWLTDEVVSGNVMPRLSLASIVELSRSSTALNTLSNAFVTQKFKDQAGNFDLGALYEEHIKFGDGDDDEEIFDLVPLVMATIKKMYNPDNFMLNLSLNYVATVFFKRLGEPISSEFIWVPELKSFYDALFKYQTFDKPLALCPHMIVGSNPDNLKRHLGTISHEDLLNILVHVGTSTPPAELWKMLAKKTEPKNKYLRMLSVYPNLNDEKYKVKPLKMTPETFCLYARLTERSNMYTLTPLIGHTTVKEYDPAWYFYMIIFQVPFSTLFSCLKERKKMLGPEVITRGVLAATHVSYNPKLYMYFRYTTVAAVKDLLKGKEMTLGKITPRDALEAAMMMDAHDRICETFMNRKAFVHDLPLIMVAMMKKKPAEFIEALMATKRDGPYQCKYLSLPFPGGQTFNFPFDLPFKLAKEVLARCDCSGQFLLFSVSTMSDWSLMVDYAIEAGLVNQETCSMLLRTVPELRLPDLVIQLIPYCIKHVLNTNFDNRHPHVRAHVLETLQKHIRAQSYRTLFGWSYALGGIEFEADSLLGWIKCESQKSIKLF